MPRKVYCEVVEGVVYDDRCLYKLCKVIEDNKTCENCILRELEKKKNSIVEFYDSATLTKLLGKAGRTINHWAKTGKIPAQKIGLVWKFPKDEIDRWIKEKAKGVEDED